MSADKPKSTREIIAQFSSGSARGIASATIEATSGADMQMVVSNQYESGALTLNPDGSSQFTFSAWPGPMEAKEYGPLAAIPLPEGIALFVGRVIIHQAILEANIKELLRKLCRLNGTTLDWGSISKYSKLITRLQAEAEIISARAPVAAEIIKTASETTRKLQRSRGNLAHGDINLELVTATFCLWQQESLDPRSLLKLGCETLLFKCLGRCSN